MLSTKLNMSVSTINTIVTLPKNVKYQVKTVCHAQKTSGN